MAFSAKQATLPAMRMHESHNESREPTVAIIGGGWAGLQTAQTLKADYGIDCIVFDKWSTVGGTWNEDMRYFGLHTHSPRWNNMYYAEKEFIEYPESGAEPVDPHSPCPNYGGFSNSLVSAREVQQYSESFVRKYKLHIKSHALVKEVRYNSADDLAYLVVQRTNIEDAVEEVYGPFRKVIYSSYSGSIKLPSLAHARAKVEGGPKVLHSMNLKTDVVEEMASKGLKVAVVGAGKSACDTLWTLSAAGVSPENMIWLYRRPYSFLNVEFMWQVPYDYMRCRYRNNRGEKQTVLGLLRGFFASCTLLLCLFSDSLGLWLSFLTGMICEPLTEGAGWCARRLNGSAFKNAAINRKQRDVLSKVTNRIKCEPTRITQNGLKVERLVGEKTLFANKVTMPDSINADVIIFATGYTTGFEALKLVKDGTTVHVHEEPLFEHATLPSFPCIISAANLFVTFGPVRGLLVADYCAKTLERGLLDENYMRVRASRGFFISSATRSFLQSDYSVQKAVLQIGCDLYFSGVINLGSIVEYFFTFFMLFKPSACVRCKSLKSGPLREAAATPSEKKQSVTVSADMSRDASSAETTKCSSRSSISGSSRKSTVDEVDHGDFSGLSHRGYVARLRRITISTFLSYGICSFCVVMTLMNGSAAGNLADKSLDLLQTSIGCWYVFLKPLASILHSFPRLQKLSQHCTRLDFNTAGERMIAKTVIFSVCLTALIKTANRFSLSRTILELLPGCVVALERFYPRKADEVSSPLAGPELRFYDTGYMACVSLVMYGIWGGVAVFSSLQLAKLGSSGSEYCKNRTSRMHAIVFGLFHLILAVRHTIYSYHQLQGRNPWAALDWRQLHRPMCNDLAGEMTDACVSFFTVMSFGLHVVTFFMSVDLLRNSIWGNSWVAGRRTKCYLDIMSVSSAGPFFFTGMLMAAYRSGDVPPQHFSSYCHGVFAGSILPLFLLINWLSEATLLENEEESYAKPLLRRTRDDAATCVNMA